MYTNIKFVNHNFINLKKLTIFHLSTLSSSLNINFVKMIRCDIFSLCPFVAFLSFSKNLHHNLSLRGLLHGELMNSTDNFKYYYGSYVGQRHPRTVVFSNLIKFCLLVCTIPNSYEK